MKEKKHIDRLFEESFKNFEATPSPKVWENIQAKLKEEKRERKVLPLWWKLGGVAALLALLLTVGNYVFTEDHQPQDAVVSEENMNSLENTPSEDVVGTDAENATQQVASEEVVTENDAEISNTNGASENRTPSPALNSKTTNAVQNGVVERRNASKERIAIETPKTKNNNSIKTDFSENKNPSEKTGKVATQTEAVATVSEKNKTSETTTPNIPFKTQTRAAEEAIAEAPATAEKTEAESNKKSLLDEVLKQQTEDAVVKKEEEKGNKWDVAPNFAPVFYGSLSKGSSIDPMFADNTQSSDVNFSYGVQVSYNINKKLSIRSGVNSVDLSYATGDIELGTGPSSNALASVNYGNETLVTTALDKGTLAKNAGGNDPFANITPKSFQSGAEITQRINYYEVPVELKYALLDSKFGINVIGGVSTLFLGDNEISVTAENFEDVLGEANNLSSVSFTTNVGIGFDYKISKQFTFNVEPMFKYQLNPYTDASVDFQPYYLGVYSGLSFKF